MELSALTFSILIRAILAVTKWKKGGPHDQAVRVTADQFPEIEHLKTSLASWSDDPRVVGELQRAYEGGANDVNVETLAEVLLDHDFRGITDPPAEARRVVVIFFSMLEKKILEDPTQSAAFVYGSLREHDTRSEENNAKLFEAVQQIDRKVSALSAIAAPEDAPTSPLDAQIDLARKRLLADCPREALALLMEIETGLDRRNAPPRILFRLITNRAACNLELGREDEALAGFEAAHQLQPDDHKSLANLALVRLIRGQNDEAEKIARRVLDTDPKQPGALTVLAQALERRGERDTAIRLLKPFENESGIRTALALLYLNAERWADVQALLEPVSATSRSIQENLFLGESYTKVAERQLKSASPLLSEMPTDMLAKVRSVDGLLAPVVEVARKEASPALLPALTLRASARLMTNRWDEATKDLEEASKVDRAPERVFRNLGLAYMIQENPSKAASTFREALGLFAEKEEEIRPLLVEALVAAQQREEAVREGKHAWAEAQSSETRREAGLSYAMALAASGNGGEAEAVVAALRQSFPDDPEIELHWAEALGRLGRHVEAVPILEAQLDKAKGAVRALTLVHLGDAYARCERFDAAADTYNDIAHPVDSPATFQKYLFVLYKSGRWAEALEAAARARQNRGGAWPPISEGEIEGQILEELGHLAGAQALYEGILGLRGNDYNIQLRLARVLFRRDESPAAKVVLDSATKEVGSASRDLLRVAQLYYAIGEMDTALRYAYRAVRGDTGDPQVALGYIGIVLATPESGRVGLDHDCVQPGSAVELETEGHTHRFTILEDLEVPTNAEELKPSDRLANQLLGRRVGETIVLDAGPPVKREASIRAIHHRYVAEFQKALARYPIRHAGEGGIVALPVREDFHDQVRSLVRKRFDHTRRLFEAYTRLPITIGILAARFDRTAFETLLALAHDPDMHIVSRDGSKESEEAARATLGEAEAIALDPTGIATLALLSLTEVPGRLAARVIVPQEFLDQLQNEILHRRVSEGREYMVLSVEGDSLTRRAISPEEHDMGTQMLVGIREKCKAFDVRPRPVTPGKWAEWADRKTLGPDSADAVAIARSSDAVLVSADGRLLGAVSNDYGVKTVSVYDLVQFFLRKGLISEDSFDDAVATLVWHGFQYTPVRPSTMMRTLRSASYQPSAKWKKLLSVLADPATSDESAMRVVGEFLLSLSRVQIIPPNVEQVVRSSLESLAIERSPRMLNEVEKFLKSTLGVPNWMKKLVSKCADYVDRSINEAKVVRP